MLCQLKLNLNCNLVQFIMHMRTTKQQAARGAGVNELAG